VSGDEQAILYREKSLFLCCLPLRIVRFNLVEVTSRSWLSLAVDDESTDKNQECHARLKFAPLIGTAVLCFVARAHLSGDPERPV
jgi:hypothetical protein